MGKKQDHQVVRRHSGPPASIKKAFELLDGMLSRKDKERILSQTQSEFVISEHFGLGLWVRNNWYYGADEEARRSLFGDRIIHLDSASDEFLTKYYQHLNKKELRNEH